MHGADLAIRSRAVVTPEGVREACVHVSDGTIARVAPFDEVPAGVRLEDVGEPVILPGLIDTHVHVNEPGRTEWEGFETATRAAAAGGVTTIVDMPLNSIPPTTSVAALEEKRAVAEPKVHVDTGFWGGAVPDALGSLRELHDGGVFGFKAFLCPSGVDEFPPLDLGQLRKVMEEIAAFDGLLIVHAELPEELIDVDNGVLLPGLVDTHVHVNEPGRTEWEGFETATRAAAAGGVTTIVDMPLNSIPPTTSVAALEEKRAVAVPKVHVDTGFWGGAVPDALGSLRELHDGGVFGFKAFLCPSGVDEFPPLDLGQLRKVMEEIAAFDGLLVVHAELPEELIAEPEGDRHAYATYLASRPHEAELRAIEAVVETSRDTGCRAHVLHLSFAGGLDLLDGAERVTVETCPHYLTFEADEIEHGATAFKCSPPIRDVANRERLWDGLRDGRIDAVVSDHSPSTPELKGGSFLDAWGGIASVELGLRAVWSQARARGLALEDVARWMCAGPAAVAGLERKGAIAEGMDADLVVVDPDVSAEFDPAELHHRHPITPYAGMRLDGRVLATYVRGVEVYADGRFPNEHAGRLLRRGEA